MKWVLAVFGKAGSPFIADEVEKYVKRLRGGMFPLEVVELKESKLDDRAQSLAQEAQFPLQEVNPSSPMASRSGMNFMYFASCSARMRFCSSVMALSPFWTIYCSIS